MWPPVKLYENHLFWHILERLQPRTITISQATLYLRPLNAKDAIKRAIDFADTRVVGSNLTVKIATYIGPEQILTKQNGGGYESQLLIVDQYIQQIEQSQIDVICEQIIIVVPPQYGYPQGTVTYTAPAPGAPYAKIEVDLFLPPPI